MTWQAAAVGAQRLLHCAFQATKSEKCQGNFFTVFHMQRGQEEGEKKPHAAFKAGKEANWSTILRTRAPRLRREGRLLCSPCGWLTPDPEKPVPQTAETCSSSSSSVENPGDW